MFVLFLENVIFTAECSMVTGTLPKRIGRFEEDMYKEPQTVYKIWGIRETAKHTGQQGRRHKKNSTKMPTAPRCPKPRNMRSSLRQLAAPRL